MKKHKTFYRLSQLLGWGILLRGLLYLFGSLLNWDLFVPALVQIFIGSVLIYTSIRLKKRIWQLEAEQFTREGR